MSKKKLDASAITSELTGASLFFQQPHKTSSHQKDSQAGESKNVHSDERPNGRTNVRPSVQKPTRRIIRHAFDIYADQLFALQAIQLEAVQSSRKKPKLGNMVQKAIDLYLQDRKKSKTTS